MFYDRFFALCQKKGVSPSRAAAEIGFDKSNVSQWKKRGLTPRAAVLNEIADYFGVSIDYLLTGGEQVQKPPNPKVEGDVSVQLDTLKARLLKEDGIMFDNYELTEQDAILLAQSLDNVKALAKTLAEHHKADKGNM